MSGVVTSSARDGESRFLVHAPPEIRDLLDWYRVEPARKPASPETIEFAASFLGAMAEDGAIIPTHAAPPAETLALTLLHHLNNPRNAAAWLNLGLALRRMSLHRLDDTEQPNQQRLQLALASFERSLQLEPEDKGKNIRAWIGQALTYHQMGLYQEEERCCLRALEADRSDPSLWLFYAFALRAAGKERDALSAIEDAYRAYVQAGKPEGLRHLFGDDPGKGPTVEVFRKRGL